MIQALTRPRRIAGLAGAVFFALTGIVGCGKSAERKEYETAALACADAIQKQIIDAEMLGGPARLKTEAHVKYLWEKLEQTPYLAKLIEKKDRPASAVSLARARAKLLFLEIMGRENDHKLDYIAEARARLGAARRQVARGI